LLVWADGETNQTAAGALHAGFRMNGASGVVAVVRLEDGLPVVVDYIGYQGLGAHQSYGAYPEGDAWNRQLFDTPTPAAANNPTSAPVEVRINEWMADNELGGVLADESGDFADWIELYNPGATGINLAGYRVTDNTADTNKFVIPPGWNIPARGFLLLWANKEASTLQYLHTGFKLNASTGGVIAVFAPDGRCADLVRYGPQRANVGEGVYPDGGTEQYALPLATPGAANRRFEVTAIRAGAPGELRMTWNTLPGHEYRVMTTPSLQNTNWLAYGPDTNAHADTLTVTVSPDQSNRFFRLMQVR